MRRRERANSPARDFIRPAIGLAALAGLLWLAVSCGTMPAFARLVWRPLPALPDREGFAGAFAGVSAGSLLVAGGANFPQQKPWAGGKKIWHDTVFALDQPDGQWRVAGRLPRPLGYGVSVTVRAGVVCIGGSDADRHYADCFWLTLENGRARTRLLPALPLPLANMGGAAIGDVIYIGGGSDRPGELAALGRLFALDLAAPNAAWKELEPCPGRPRLMPVAAAVDGCFYLAGGVDIIEVEGRKAREYLSDVWCYQPGRGWRRAGNLPKPVAAAPSPAPVVGSTFYVVGGDDGSLAGFQPVEKHPGFPGELRAYDARAGQWRRLEKIPAPRATLPAVWWQGGFVLPSGEVRPGVRSPEVWWLQITQPK